MTSVDGKPSPSPRPHIHIRPLDIDDLPLIFHLGERLFTRRITPNAYRIWDEHEVVAFFQENWDTCFVAENQERIVGFVLGSIIEKNDSSWVYGYLTWLGVDPSLKGLGIGKRLLKEFIQASQKLGARMLIVDTDADNHRALDFFEHAGFGNREEHVYLTLNLSAAAKKNGVKPKHDGKTG